MAETVPNRNVLIKDRVFLSRDLVKEIAQRVGVPKFHNIHHLTQESPFNDFLADFPRIFNHCRHGVYVLDAVNAFDPAFPHVLDAMIRKLPFTHLVTVYGGLNKETNNYNYWIAYVSPAIPKLDTALKPVEKAKIRLYLTSR